MSSQPNPTPASPDPQANASQTDTTARSQPKGLSSKMDTPQRLQGVSPVALAGLAVAAAVLILHALHFDFINDDAFISFRYADNLVRHGELTYNPGERVEGYTNFLWTLMIAGVMALGGDPVPWSKALGVCFGLGSLTTVFAFGRWWHRNRLDAATAAARNPLWLAVAPLWLALNSAFAAWTEGGLETSLFTFLITVGILRAYVEITTDAQKPWSGVAFALAAMTRPDGLLIVGLVGLFRGIEGMIRRRSPLPSKLDWIWGGGLLAVYIPYWLWRFNYYGYVWPNTYYAKGDSPMWDAGLRYLGGFVWDCHIWLIAPLALLPWRTISERWRLQALVGTVAVPFMLYYARVGGDFMALYRFYVPLLPVLAFVGQEGLVSLWEGLRDQQAQSQPGRAWKWRSGLAAATLVAALAVQNWGLTQKSLEIGSDRGVDSIGWLKMFVGQTTAIGKYIHSAYPPDTTLATTAAGVIPFYAQHRTLDLLALNDVYTAHNVTSSGRRPGHSKSAPEPYVLKWAPTLLIRHPRIAKAPPNPSARERQYWKRRGYKFAYAKVPGLEPPYWGWYESTQTAAAPKK